LLPDAPVPDGRTVLTSPDTIGIEAVKGHERHPPPFIRDTNTIESLHTQIRTSTYFEAAPDQAGDETKAATPLRVRGHSKDHRPDLPQVVIGLAVTKEGIPVLVWVWPGHPPSEADKAAAEREKGFMDCGCRSALAYRSGHHEPRLAAVSEVTDAACRSGPVDRASR